MTTMTTMTEARAVLQKHWGYPDFRSWQAEILPDILEGRDTLCVAPTGGGKSVLYQLPALMRDGTTLVVSPLIALMRDQVEDALSRGIPASYVNSHVEADEAEVRFGDFVAGAFKIFFVAPERLRSRTFMEALSRAHVSCIAVDEAHCASQWGHDFRPSYGRIFELVRAAESAQGFRPQVLGVTATATHEIENDIALALGMKEYVRYVADPVRPNLSYECQTTYSPWRVAETLFDRVNLQKGRGLVYAATRNMTESIASVFMKSAPAGAVGVYHAGMREDDRTRVQDQFKSGELRLVVATSAFGMGIDVPDIRMVAHFGIPDSLESYCQQAGRAGRDGEPARCVLVHSDKSVEIQRFFVDGSNPPYSLLEEVWDDLHRMLPDSTAVLRESAAKLAAKAGVTGFDVKSSQWATALSMLEKAGALQRGYDAQATPVELNLPKAERLMASDVAHKSVRAIAGALHALLSPHKKTGPIVSALISKSEVAQTAGVSMTVVSTVLRKMEEQGVATVGKTFTGKTTRIIRYGEKLEAFLPREAVEAKRRRAQRRLAAMLDYASVPDEQARRTALRDYFLGGDE